MDTISCVQLLNPVGHGSADCIHHGLQRLGGINGMNTFILCSQFQIAGAGAIKEIERLLLNTIQLAARTRLSQLPG